MSRVRNLLSCFILLLHLHFCTSSDTITTSQSLKDGNLLISSNETYALGFFSPGNSSNRYIGIWYNKVSEQTVVWVANRDNPINDTSGVLSVENAGKLVIYGRDGVIPVWSANGSGQAHSAQLLDSGNLVVLGGNDSKRIVVWQSFDYPTNTMLPDMKLGVDRNTGLDRFLKSWKSGDDPGTGEFSYKLDLNGSPQFFLYQDSTPVWRTGPWIGHGWSGVPDMTANFIFNVTYVENPDEVYAMYGMRDKSVFSRLAMNESGVLERKTWHEADRKWVAFWWAPKDQCDYYGQCGPFGNCDPTIAATLFECTCLPGFKPKSARDWYLRDGSGGCVRKRGGQVCGNGEGFVKVARAKVPSTWTSRVERSKAGGLEECAEECLRNCTCNAYASADVSQGGCVTWHGDLIDTRVFSSGGQDLYIRVDAVELAQYMKSQESHGKKSMVPVIVSSAVAVLLLIICFSCWLTMRKRKAKRGHHKLPFSPNSSTSFETSPKGNNQFDETRTNAELPFFDLISIAEATENFSSANKLGQGGFGTVYKGRLYNGKEIAVKRLAKNSGQGVEEFKNEVTLIAKLQHRNLVRLLGCCIQKEEKMLIYEYLPNKGLDSFIFDRTKRSFLDWKKRFNIILGIARGLLYLHQDSRLRIIHRDMKASNVLLDAAMDPKISDFGMAKIFGGDQIEANTNRVVGTYGYMAPEYAMEGLFSIKSDVFSFGVLLLEIISGRKNNSYYQEDSVNLIGHVWNLWEEGQAPEVVDSSMGEPYPVQEVLRCVHIGLLCVQELPTDRPTMSDVAFMLCNETALPPPKQPAFIFFKRTTGPDSSSASAGAISVNELTVTMVQAR